jgi:hypothetical protein
VNNGKKTWFLLPLLAALTFGGSAIDVFTFGQTSVTWGFCFLGFSFGIWCLVRIKRDWLVSLLIGLAGALCCWSGAIGFLVWPAFLVMMLVLGKRKWWQYAALFGAAGFSGIPYVYFLFINPGTNKAVTSIIYANFKYNIFATTYGWPFSNGIGINVFPNANDPAFWAGTLGLIAGFLAIIFYLLSWHTPVRKQGVPALALLTFGILSPFKILTFRQYIDPWYNPQLLVYWAGLVILGYVFWKNRRTSPAIFGLIKGRSRAALEKGLPPAMASWAVGFFIILGVLYAANQFTFEDKTLFLRFRAPASTACIREYKNASGICSATLYNGNFAYPASYLAAPLEKNYMSVFAPDQQWSLQGDFIINGKVTVEQNPNYIYKYWPDNVVTEPLPWLPTASQPPSQGVYWTSDLGKTVLPWSHFKHLNLFLQSPDAVTWHLTLPDNLNEANFVTAVTFSDLAPLVNGMDGATFKIFVQEKGQPDKLVASKALLPTEHSWQPISFSLKEYAGKSISLRLTSDYGKTPIGDWGLFQYPHIDLKLDPNKMKPVPEENLKEYIPQPSDDDLILNAQNPNLWYPTNVVPDSAPGDSVTKWKATNPASIMYTKPFNACLSNYSQLYLRLGVQFEGTTNRYLRMYYRLNGHANFQPDPIVMGLENDSERHNYFYDLKLLSLDPKVCITGLSIQVLDTKNLGPIDLNFELADVRFIKNPLAPPPTTAPPETATPVGLDKLLPAYITIDGKTPTQSQIMTTSSQTLFITGADNNWLGLQPEYPKFWPVTNGAKIYLYSSAPQRVQFQLVPVGFVANPKAPNGQGTQGTLQLVFNKTSLPEKPLIVNGLYTVDINLQAGWNTIQFNYKEGSYRPAAFDPASTNQNQGSFLIAGINIKTAQPGTSRTEGIDY